MIFWFGLAGAIWLTKHIIRQGLRQGKSPGDCILSGWMTLLGFGTLILGAISLLRQHNLITFWQQEFQTSLRAAMEVYRQQQWEPAELERAARGIKFLFIDAIYGWLAVFLLLVAILIYTIQKQQAQRQGIKIAPLFFLRWAAPEGLIWVLIANLMLLAFGLRWSSGLMQSAVNGLVVLAWIYGLNGVAVIRFYFCQYQLSRAIEFWLLVLAGLFPAVGLLIALAGVMDTWIDWRKLRKREK